MCKTRNGRVLAAYLLLEVVFASPKNAVPSSAPKVLLGRPGNNLKAGIVGLPNVGKSTFFNLLCKMSVPAENYPFCTIEPTLSRVVVPDERFDWLCAHYKPASQVNAYFQVTDIAGLVRGAAEGQGLGNAFLSHIQAVDCLLHMVRAFEDPEVTHVEDSVDPVRDLDIISKELLAKDLEWAKQRQQHLAGKARGTKPGSPESRQLELVTKVVTMLQVGQPVRQGNWSILEVEVLNEMSLLTAKPAVVLCNLCQDDFLRRKNKWLPKIKAWTDAHGGDPLIPISCVYEKYLADGNSPLPSPAGAGTSGVASVMPKIIHSGLAALRMEHFFTVGHDEVRAWGIRQGTRAPQAAGQIHSDMEKGFICAETMAFQDLRQMGNEVAVRASGRYRSSGKDYIVQDGDCLHFKFSPPNTKKKA